MSQSPDKRPIDAYLDGLLPPAEAERARRALRDDPRAQAQADLQGRIDKSLTRLFAPSAVGAPVAARRGPLRLSIWTGAIAAAVLLAALGAWQLFFRTAPAGPSPLGPLYHSTIAAGFTPKEVCTDRDKFADWCEYAYGQYLLPPKEHDGIEFVGWNYARVITATSGVLLARVSGREVLVVIDKAFREEHQIADSGDPALHIFRKQLGRVVLYEVTPHDKPAIIPILATTPDSPTGG